MINSLKIIDRLSNAIDDITNTTDEIVLVHHSYIDGGEVMTEDDISNSLLALEVLHKLRARKLKDIFDLYRREYEE